MRLCQNTISGFTFPLLSELIQVTAFWFSDFRFITQFPEYKEGWLCFAIATPRMFTFYKYPSFSDLNSLTIMPSRPSFEPGDKVVLVCDDLDTPTMEVLSHYLYGDSYSYICSLVGTTKIMQVRQGRLRLALQHHHSQSKVPLKDPLLEHPHIYLCPTTGELYHARMAPDDPPDSPEEFPYWTIEDFPAALTERATGLCRDIILDLLDSLPDHEECSDATQSSRAGLSQSSSLAEEDQSSCEVCILL